MIRVPGRQAEIPEETVRSITRPFISGSLDHFIEVIDTFSIFVLQSVLAP
jgi:hypothetical protein